MWDYADAMLASGWWEEAVKLVDTCAEQDQESRDAFQLPRQRCAYLFVITHMHACIHICTHTHTQQVRSHCQGCV